MPTLPTNNIILANLLSSSKEGFFPSSLLFFELYKTAAQLIQKQTENSMKKHYAGIKPESCQTAKSAPSPSSSSFFRWANSSYVAPSC